MLIKATRLHPGVPLQPVMVDLVVTEVVVNGMVVVEAAVAVIEVVVGILVVVDLVDVVMLAITEAAVWWISFLALSLSSIEGHCQSSPLSSTLTSVLCTWPLSALTDPRADRQRTEIRIEIMFGFIFLPIVLIIVSLVFVFGPKVGGMSVCTAH